MQLCLDSVLLAQLADPLLFGEPRLFVSACLGGLAFSVKVLLCLVSVTVLRSSVTLNRLFRARKHFAPCVPIGDVVLFLVCYHLVDSNGFVLRLVLRLSAGGTERLDQLREGTLFFAQLSESSRSRPGAVDFSRMVSN